VEDVETFCCPDVSGELVPPMRSQDSKHLDFVEWLARSDGGTSRLAVAMRSERAGVYGLTISRVETGDNVFAARYARTNVFKRMPAATGNQRRERRSGVVWVNLGRRPVELLHSG